MIASLPVTRRGMDLLELSHCFKPHKLNGSLCCFRDRSVAFFGQFEVLDPWSIEQCVLWLVFPSLFLVKYSHDMFCFGLLLGISGDRSGCIRDADEDFLT